MKNTVDIWAYRADLETKMSRMPTERLIEAYKNVGFHAKRKMDRFDILPQEVRETVSRIGFLDIAYKAFRNGKSVKQIIATMNRAHSDQIAHSCVRLGSKELTLEDLDI